MSTREIQIDLFAGGDLEADPVGTVAASPELAAVAARLPRALRFGTSSWAFPGWTGIVYTRRVGEQMLAREGLAAYARHPLLRAVGLDRTFYAPLPASELQRYARSVPDDFRFVVKAHALLTTPIDRQSRNNAVVPEVDRFLDVGYAIERVVQPAVEGLGTRLGALLFQFAPLAMPYSREPQLFVAALGEFLDALPRGPQYAVEVRDAEVLSAGYVDALARNGATHCFNVHPRMPSVLQQAATLGDAAWLSGAVVLRWMLHPRQDYEAARERYFPFDGLIDPDHGNRAAMAELIEKIVERGNELLLIANNKAEGCAPLSVFGLARELDQRGRLRRAGPDPDPRP